MQSPDIIESESFRKLLLFVGQDVKGFQLPSRTKVREDILRARQDYFITLKNELAVSFMFILTDRYTLNIFLTECLW